MEFEEFTAGENDSGRRLDRVLRIMLKDRAGEGSVNVFSALRKRLILVNGGKAEASAKVKCGDSIKIASFLLKKSPEDRNSYPNSPEEKAFPNTRHECYANFSLDAATIFRNDSILVINKPYGISVQPSFSSDTSLSQIVAEKFKEENSLSFTPAPLHRLDRFTTGALVFSLSIDGARVFSKMLQSGLVKKTYVAVVQGLMQEEFEWTDSIDDGIPKGAKAFHTVQVSRIPPGSNFQSSPSIAVTKALPLAHGRWNDREVTLARFEIPTGKKHQIRAQSAFHGFPLLGDRAYGGAVIEGREFFLHSIQIEFPSDNSLSLPPKIQAPLPKEFSNFLNSALINWNGQLII
ncbi:MAG: RluA family pseudouridine synthase [Treponema sp.]|nr:RluA family pseudouridine synthase [Treponema sp.]